MNICNLEKSIQIIASIQVHLHETLNLVKIFVQTCITNVIYDDIYDAYGDAAPRGLSGESLKKLPCHVILDMNKTTNICCTICLQVSFILFFFLTIGWGGGVVGGPRLGLPY